MNVSGDVQGGDSFKTSQNIKVQQIWIIITLPWPADKCSQEIKEDLYRIKWK